jgi:hypothetical protein
MCEYPVATNRYDTSVLKRSHTSGAECGGGFSLSGIRALVYHFNMSCPVIQVGTVRTQDIALSMACAINQYKGTDLLELKILLEI